MFISALTIAVSVYVLLSIIIYLFQGRFVYFPGKDLILTPAAIQLNYEDVIIETSHSNKIHGWYLPHPQPRGQVLFLHGNGGNISHRLDTLNIFHELALSILIIDYQGYGQSEGSPTEQSTYDDARAALNYLLIKQKDNGGPLIYFGRSLGGAVASWLAEQHPPGVLILESTFTSVMDIGRHYYPYLPVNLLTRYRYDTIERIKRIHCPVLIVHSPDDEIISYRYGEQLYESANEPKSFLKIRGGHNDGFITSGALYQNGIRSFLDHHLLSDDESAQPD